VAELVPTINYLGGSDLGGPPNKDTKLLSMAFGGDFLTICVEVLGPASRFKSSPNNFECGKSNFLVLLFKL
jgi:hypothetical protein